MSLRYVFFALSLPLLMGAEVYRYVDANGVITYAQQLPDGVSGEKITTIAGAPSVKAPATPTPPAAAPAQPVLTPQQQAMLDDLKKAEQARLDEIARIREANCTRSKEVLDRLSTRGRIRVTDAEGNQTKMSEEDRQARIEEAQRGIVANCSPEKPETDAAAAPTAVANAGG